MNHTSFVKKAHKVHGEIYSYHDEYVGSHTKIAITCPTHGIFYQTPSNHINSKNGCPACGVEKNKSNRRKSSIDYFTKVRDIHNNKYVYDEESYIGLSHNITYTCPIHGSVKQLARSHLHSKAGCRFCSSSAQKSTNDFIKKSNNLHNNKYEYHQSDYTTNKQQVTITCPIHGDFQQIASDHMNNGHGCPKCSSRVSSGEISMADWLFSVTDDIVTNSRNIISPYELDVYLPKHNVAIEYCGLYWHSEQQGKDKKYHQRKLNMCTDMGIRLLTIYEDEWLQQTNIVKNKILHTLNLSNDVRISARKCDVITVSRHSKQTFFDATHIQGSGPSSINYGLEINGELVAVMGFNKTGDTEFCLNRYSTKYHIIGGFTRLLKHFQRNNVWSKLVSFSDNRWSTGELYKATGWTCDKNLPPDYCYVVNNQRYHKFGYRHKHLATKLSNYNPALSERENCDNAGLLRLWDCGKQRFIMLNT